MYAMRTSLLPLLLLLAAGPAAAGKPDAGPSKAALDFVRSLTCTPAFVQGEFLKKLQKDLDDALGEERAAKMWRSFKDQDLDAKDLLDLMNGAVEKGHLKAWFGGDLAQVEAAVAAAVDSKERGLLFGALAVALVADAGVDPASDLCKHVCAARDAISADDFKKLKRGSLTKGAVEDAFGLSSKDEQKLLQEALRKVQQSPYVNHPLAESLGMKNRGFEPAKFPEPAEGMPGYGQEAGGGFPVDPDLPPCPYLGEQAGGGAGAGDSPPAK